MRFNLVYMPPVISRMHSPVPQSPTTDGVSRLGEQSESLNQVNHVADNTHSDLLDKTGDSKERDPSSGHINSRTSQTRSMISNDAASQGVSTRKPHLSKTATAKAKTSKSGRRSVKSIVTINQAVSKLPLPPDPREPVGSYEENMYAHWHGEVDESGKITAHSHAQEFMRLENLKQIGFDLDEVRDWVAYMSFSEWHTRQCIDKGLPEVPHRVTPELTRIGQYQEHYNLWSVHEIGDPSDIVTFLRPEARKMTEAELAILQRFSYGIDAVAKKMLKSPKSGKDDDHAQNT